MSRVVRSVVVGMGLLLAAGTLLAEQPVTSRPKGVGAARPVPGAAEIERAEAFGRLVTDRMSQGDTDPFERAIDYESIVGSALHGLGLSDTARRAYVRNVVAGMKQSGGLATQMAGATVRFMRVKEFDGRPVLVFSVAAGDAGFNYLLFDFEVRGGEVRLVDLFSLAVGERTSEGIRRMMIPVIAEQDRGLLERVFGESKGESLSRNYDRISAMSRAAQASDPASVIREYEALDDEFKGDRIAMSFAQTAYAATGADDKLIAITARYREAFPDDPSLPLSLFDSQFVRGEWDAALAGLDQIDRQIGGDPYLSTMRAAVLHAAGRHDAALEQARLAAEGVPSMEDPLWMLATVAASAGRHDEVAATFRELRRFEYWFVDGTVDDPTFAEFLRSDAAAALFAEEAERMAEAGLTRADLGFE